MIEAELQKFLAQAISQSEGAVEVSDLLEAEVLIIHRDPMIHELVSSASKGLGSGFNIALHHASSVKSGVSIAQAPETSLAAVFFEKAIAGDVQALVTSLAATSSRMQQVVAIVASDGELAELMTAEGIDSLPSLRETVAPSLFIDGCRSLLHELKLRFNLLQSFRDTRSLLELASDLPALQSMISASLAQLASFFEVDALLIADLKNPASETSATMTRTQGIHEILRRSARREQEQLSRSQAAELRLLASLVGAEHVVEALDDETSTARLEPFKALTFEGQEIQLAFAYGMQDSLTSAFAIAAKSERRDARLLLSEFSELFEAWALRHERLTMRTLKKRLQEDEIQAKQSLNAAITEMVCGVAHEINTPLGIIRTAASIVSGSVEEQADSGIDEDFLEDLNDSSKMIESNVKRLGELVERFKSVAVSQSPEKSAEGRISDPIEKAIDRVRVSNTGLIINKILELDPGSDEWLGYPQRLEEVVFQLLENAAQHGYDGKGGMIELRLRGRVLDAKTRYSLEVTDFGKGIAPDEQSRIFDAFFTTSRITRSTGLGLAMVKSITEDALGGKIRLKSNPGSGSTFTVDFQSLSEPDDAEPAQNSSKMETR